MISRQVVRSLVGKAGIRLLKYEPRGIISRSFSTTVTQEDKEKLKQELQNQENGIVDQFIEKKLDPKAESEPAPEKSQEDFYRAKIVQEITQGPVLNNQEEIKVNKADLPEKDKAFVEKKTTIWDNLRVVWEHMKHSFKDLWIDTKYISRLLKDKGLKTEKYTLKELRERRRISMELFKFMPYSFFIVVPLAELLIPPYLILFPNSTPGQFLTSAQKGDITKKLAQDQIDGYNLIVRSLPKFSKLIDIDPIRLYESLSNLQNTEGREKDRQFYTASDLEEKLMRFLDRRNKEALVETISLETLNSFELEQISKIFYRRYVPGYNFLNILWKIPFKFPFWATKKLLKLAGFKPYKGLTKHWFYKFQFSLDSGPLSIYKKYLLIAQLRFHIRQIRKQDEQLAKDLSQLNELSQLELVDYAKQRGIIMEDKEEILNYIEKYWIPISTRKDISDDLLVWTVLLRFKYADILV